MNYLARICLGALSFPLLFPLPTFFSLQFPFDLRLFFFLSFALLLLNAYFFDSARSYSSRNFLQGVAGSAGKSFEKPILSSEAAAKKSLYILILSVPSSLFQQERKKNQAPIHTPSSQADLWVLITDKLEIVHVIWTLQKFITLTTGSPKGNFSWNSGYI